MGYHIAMIFRPITFKLLSYLPLLLPLLLLSTTLLSVQIRAQTDDQPGERLEEQSHGVILLYHHVDTSTPPSTSISPQDFRKHLEYLRDNGFTVVALDQMISSLREKQPLPDKTIAITFDDGYSSIYQTAFPMLQEFGFPFTLFLSTGPINNAQANYMNWAEVKQMSDAGVLIANHMVEHPYMLEHKEGESDGEWIERLRKELLEAENSIAEQTGQSHRFLAYPYGEYNPRIVAMIEQLGFTGFAQNSGAINSQSDFLRLPRYPLASIYANIETAATKLQSLAFNAARLEPISPVTMQRSPAVTLQFKPGNYRLSQISCFANSQPLEINWIDEENGIAQLNPKVEYQGRRWRYICTAPAPDSNRYYWYSVQWIKPD